ncbi:MAG TPA: hypothetical protein VKD21_08150 [Acidimicrobiales bacterium]|nr:hypothetical protein [Acidimicrobiales bacterium]
MAEIEITLPDGSTRALPSGSGPSSSKATCPRSRSTSPGQPVGSSCGAGSLAKLA